MTTSRKSAFPKTTIIPDGKEELKIWMNEFYQDVANSIETPEDLLFETSITSTATDMPNVPSYGSFMVVISGVESSLPTYSAVLNKSDKAVAGSIAALGSQAGTGTWAGVNLSITSTAGNYQVAHSGAASLEGKFIINVSGTRKRTSDDD